MTGKKLLVADDSLTIQKVIKLALSNEGYQIQTVSDGNDAIGQITLTRPDAVLIDVSLPGKTAFEVKRAINELADYPEVRFVLMSSAFERFDEVEAQAVGMDGRLTKPFEPGQLRQVLSEVLAKTIAKRVEKTAFIEKPQAAMAPPPAPPRIHLDPPEFDSAEDDDLPPMTPEQMPALEESEAPPVVELWDSSPNFETPPMSNSPELQVESGQNADTDIRRLTESTIRMSGLEEFDWTINEPKQDPPAPPQRHVSPPSFAPSQVNAPTDIPAFAPPPPPAYQASSFQASPKYSAPEALTIPPPPSFGGEPYSFESTGAADMDETIRKHVHEALEKMTKKILPEIAERLIKEEIHRMLQEEHH